MNLNTIGPQAVQGALQAPFNTAVIIPTVLRESLLRAVRSVFAQEWPGRIQILIGVDIAEGDRDLLRQLGAECPERMALTIFDPGYSTAQVHGGIYHNAYSGSLRTVLSYAANRRFLAYLDDDNWWAAHHLSDLINVIDGFDWAFTYRWFVDPGTQEPICADDFESIGPGRGIYNDKLGGFVDAMMIDKTCHFILPQWSIPLTAAVINVIDGFDWAFTYRWFVDPGTQEPICADDFESIGPGRGIYNDKLGGFVDANCLMIDKTRCHFILPQWSIPLLPDGSGEDRNVFNALKKQHSVAWTKRPSVYYVINPNASTQPVRDKILAERGHKLSTPQRGKSATFAHRDERINEYLLSNLTRKLHLGAGPNLLPGWLNTDIAPHSKEVLALDLSKALPFDDESFDYIASEHFIEHMPLADGIRLLGECFRILKKGGQLRLATPDITKLLALYTAEPSDLQKSYVEWVNKTYIPGVTGYNPTLILNNMFYNWGHRFIYDRTLLASVMAKAGFADLASHAIGESPDPNFANIEKHGHLVGAPDLNAYETMAIEGRKP